MSDSAKSEIPKTSPVPAYEKLLFETLDLKPYIERYKANIFVMLIQATERAVRCGEELIGFQNCFHVASSAVINGSKNLNQTLQRLRNDLDYRGADPSTILTMAALYYLLLRVTDHTINPKEQARIRYVWRRFEDMNWMVGPRIMKILGIPYVYKH